jgi:hypothetical protein
VKFIHLNHSLGKKEKKSTFLIDSLINNKLKITIGRESEVMVV